MAKAPEIHPDGVSIGDEARKQRRRNRELRQTYRELERLTPTTQTAPIVIPDDRPEHYHVVYEMGKIVVPHWQERYPTARSAYLKVKELGDASEPHTEWYEDGRVQIETPLHGRTGLFRVTLRVTACVATKCGPKEGSPSPLILPTLGGLH